MFQRGLKEQMVGFHSSVLSTKLLQKCNSFSQGCDLFWGLLMPPFTCILFFHLSWCLHLLASKKVEVWDLRAVKMHNIEDFGHCARVCVLIWILFPVSLFFCVSMPYFTSSLPPLPSFFFPVSFLRLVLHTKTYTGNRCSFPRTF